MLIQKETSSLQCSRSDSTCYLLATQVKQVTHLCEAASLYKGG